MMFSTVLFHERNPHAGIFFKLVNSIRVQFVSDITGDHSVSFNRSLKRQVSGRSRHPRFHPPNLSHYSSLYYALSQNDQHHFEDNPMPRRSILTERQRSPCALAVRAKSAIEPPRANTTAWQVSTCWPRSSSIGTRSTSAKQSPPENVQVSTVHQSFCRTFHRLDGHTSCSRANTGGKIDDRPPYGVILPPAGTDPQLHM